ncbi:hypothetical protein [Synechococcus sp. MIT S9504]|uniref:hypothetical protein n=1 Tax=Synechococcus sp. MIT S9504 TaxID=1801628 RepID=UPI00083053DB
MSLRLLQAHSASGESSHTALVIFPRSFGELLVNRSDSTYRLESVHAEVGDGMAPGYSIRTVVTAVGVG